jgi:UDP:flavonoid glycosyltransferase YjiC (YdhE family)
VRITILSVGSRGDVQPLLAFGLGLQAAEHDVRLATYPRFESQVRAAGLDFAPLAEGQVSKMQAGVDTSAVPRRRAHRPPVLDLIADARSVARVRLGETISACKGAEAVVTNELALLLGWQACEHYGAQLVRVRLCPPPRVADRPGARAVRQLAWLPIRRSQRAARRELGLPPLPLREPLGRLSDRRTLELRAYSEAVLVDAEPMGPFSHVTGFWFLDGHIDPAPVEEVCEFLDAGPAPVCVNFGSMFNARAAADTTALVVGALRDAGQRGVLIRGADGFGEGQLGPDMLAVGAIDHDWLFPRCTAVVHHGGAGTVAAVLRAGLPSVVVPHMLDQYAWGRTLHELGVASAPIRRRRVTADALTAAVATAVEDAGMRERAAEIGAQIRAEHGVASAVDAFARHTQGAGQRSILERT